MSDATDFDLVILGGGMTGLTLGYHLAQQEAADSTDKPQALILEPRSNYSRDKTWCYWQHEPTPFDEAISHRWHRWRVSCNGYTHVSESAATPYVRVDSAKFYEIGQAAITASDNVTLRLDDSATQVSPYKNGVSVQSKSETIQARRVFDTRPTPTPEGILLQHFVGWEIETDVDVFDPSTVTLMDFAAEAEDIHFFYVLPMSPRHALIETTHFSTQVLDEADYAAEITDYLHRRFEISRWQVRHQEKGVIPMPRQAPDLSRRPHSHIVPMGLHSDTVKPSTGYCYPHAQVQARRQVDALCSNPEAMTVPARSRLNRWFDAVFIGFLERHPQRAGEIFFRLFKNVPTDALTRFLGDNAKPADYVRVMLALPKGTFILQAMRHVWRS